MLIRPKTKALRSASHYRDFVTPNSEVVAERIDVVDTAFPSKSRPDRLGKAGGTLHQIHLRVATSSQTSLPGDGQEPLPS